MDLTPATLLKTAPLRADDHVVLDYDGRLLRRKTLTSVKGRDFLISLAMVTNLDEFWGFELADGTLIRIDAAPEQVLVITGDLIRLAWHIGNRHTPCQIMADRLVIREDHVLERMITGLGGRVSRAHLPFRPEGGAYGHGRTMGHSHGPEPGPEPDRVPEPGPEIPPKETFGWHHHGDGQMHFHAPKPAKIRL